MVGPKHFDSPLANTVRKVMLVQLIDTLDEMLRSHPMADSPNGRLLEALRGAHITGILVKGSGEYAITDHAPEIPRNPRDVDLIILSSEPLPKIVNGQAPRELIYQLLEKAGQNCGIECTPVRGDELTMRQRLTHGLLNKGQCEAEVTLTAEWIDDVLARAHHLHLSEREIAWLEEARNDSHGQRIAEKIDIAMNQPVPDLPPFDRHGHSFTQGIAVNDPHVSLLDKLQAVNNIMRQRDRILQDSTFDPQERDRTTFATDLLDIYNLQQALGGMKEQDYDKIEQIIRQGSNYPSRQRIQKLENNMRSLGRGDFNSLQLRSMFSDRDHMTLEPPSEENVAALHRDLAQAYEANLIGAPVSLAKAREIYEATYELSQRILGHGMAGLGHDDPAPQPGWVSRHLLRSKYFQSR